MHHNSAALTCLEHWSVLGLATGTAPRYVTQFHPFVGAEAVEQQHTAKVYNRGGIRSEALHQSGSEDVLHLKSMMSFKEKDSFVQRMTHLGEDVDLHALIGFFRFHEK